MSQTVCRDFTPATVSATAAASTSCGITAIPPRRASVSAIRRPDTAVMLAAMIGMVAPDGSATERSTSNREATSERSGTRKTSS